MNNLKFRAWDKKLQILGTVSDIDFEFEEVTFYIDDEEELDTCQPFEDVEIMQSTGLFDKNGVEIFEGDIVEFPELYDFYDFEEGVTVNVASVVKKGSYITLDNFVYEDGITETELDNHECTFDDLDFKNFEVIGNIYEDKELLE
ncbi:YopX family protein [Parvimonas micra]